MQISSVLPCGDLPLCFYTNYSVHVCYLVASHILNNIIRRHYTAIIQFYSAFRADVSLLITPPLLIYRVLIRCHNVDIYLILSYLSINIQTIQLCIQLILLFFRKGLKQGFESVVYFFLLIHIQSSVIESVGHTVSKTSSTADELL